MRGAHDSRAVLVVGNRFRNARDEYQGGRGLTQVNSCAESGDIGEDPGLDTGLGKNGAQVLVVVTDDRPRFGGRWFR